MKRDSYSSGTPWKPVVGYTQAVRVRQFVFVSGTTANQNGIQSVEILWQAEPPAGADGVARLVLYAFETSIWACLNARVTLRVLPHILTYKACPSSRTASVATHGTKINLRRMAENRDEFQAYTLDHYSDETLWAYGPRSNSTGLLRRVIRNQSPAMVNHTIFIRVSNAGTP